MKDPKSLVRGQICVLLNDYFSCFYSRDLEEILLNSLMSNYIV